MNKKQTIQISNDIECCATVAQIIKSICGERIGFGLHRDVYVLKSDPAYVVKIERNIYNAEFANATEWRNYCNNIHWTWLERWLAPCWIISMNGQVLIQSRVEHKRRKDYPKYIPVIFTDTKLTNFGWIGERFVCCDYSFIPIIFNKEKLKYAKWWSK